MARLLLVAAVLLCIAPIRASADWRVIRTDHFRVLGDVPAARLRDVALRFEQFREVMSQLMPAAARAGTAPVVVIVFPDERAYRPFMPVAGGRPVPVAGYFVDGADVNYITMNADAGEQAFRIVFHEYSHLLLNNAFANAPIWFNEGLAEYFSTFDVTSGGRQALVGRPIRYHVELLRERRLKLAQLLAIGVGSKEYTRDSLERDLLYAQSWALVHHARHGEPKRFEALVWLARRLADGEDADGSVRGTYGVPMEKLDAEVQAYVRKQIYGHTELTFSESVVTQVKAEVRSIDDAEVDGWLADLLAHLQRGPEAIPRLERALRIRRDLPRALATLGVLRIRQGDRAEGMSLLERAAAAGPDIESVQFEYGWALATQGILEEAAVAARAQAALERALALHPGYPAATQMLASVHGAMGDYARMRDLLSPLVKAAPDNQDAALQLAAALLGLGEVPAARALLGPVLARPRDQDLRERARTLLGQISKLQQQ